MHLVGFVLFPKEPVSQSIYCKRAIADKKGDYSCQRKSFLVIKNQSVAPNAELTTTHQLFSKSAVIVEHGSVATVKKNSTTLAVLNVLNVDALNGTMCRITDCDAFLSIKHYLID